jgi:flavin reductase (DIM6/NTAB) family NADH-FMN oxidoreductase RutF
MEVRVHADDPQAPRAPDGMVEARTLRDALGCFATGVTIVTALKPDGERVGFTANSFTSVSLDPPLVLVCVAKTSSSLSALEEAQAFSINVLHAGQQHISQHFTRKGVDRFGQGEWEVWETGVPLLAESAASFECEKYAVHEAGDHLIFLGLVRGVRFDAAHKPLLFVQGKYHGAGV